MTSNPPADFAALLQRTHAKAAIRRPRAALIAPDNTDSLAAFARAAADGLVDPLIIGDRGVIDRLAPTANTDIRKIDIRPADSLDAAVSVGLELVREKAIDLLAQGGDDAAALATRLGAKGSSFIPEGGVAAHVGVIRAERYPRLLFVTDGLVHDEPDLKTKLVLASHLARICTALGVPDPRTAVVTAVEAIYPQMPATLDGAVMAKMSERGQIKGLTIDGPLSFDIAIDPEAAAAKGIRNSEVAGRTDALIASSRHVASGIYQALSLFAACDLGGVLTGGRTPVAVSFRADSVAARYNSLMLASLLA